MDFSWTEEQLAFKDEVVAFARHQLNNDPAGRDREQTFSHEDWRKCADFGIQGSVIPVEYGGRGRDVLTTILMLEALGYGCLDAGLPFGLNSQMWSVQAVLLKFGTEEQKQRYLPPLCTGETIGAFGITEPDSGSDTYAMQARARKVEGGYVLNGHKAFLTFAPLANVAIVFATVDPDKGRWGISAFIVEREMKGFSSSPVREKMGLRSVPMGDLMFEECFVPDENRLGPEGAGVSMFATAMETDRSYLLSSQVGAMQRQLETAIQYARERKQFGQPIGKFQAISHRVAEMKIRLETARLLLYKVAWLDQTQQPLTMEAAMAKVYLAECFVQSSIDSITLHGARGYTSEFEIERDLRDGIGGLIYSGTSDIQRNIISQLLGL